MAAASASTIIPYRQKLYGPINHKLLTNLSGNLFKIQFEIGSLAHNNYLGAGREYGKCKRDGEAVLEGHRLVAKGKDKNDREEALSNKVLVFRWLKDIDQAWFLLEQGVLFL